MTDEEFEKALFIIGQRIDRVNSHFISKVAQTIKKIGEMNPSSMNIFVMMVEMGKNVLSITKELQEVMGITIKDVVQIYRKSFNDQTSDPRFRPFFEDPEQNKSKIRNLRQFVEAVGKQTANTFTNFSNTTVIQQTYQDAVSDAVTAVRSGLGSYSSEIQKTVQKLGYNGLQVQYESGHRRRMDTAVRQNIVDAVKQINQHTANEIGNELGYDAVEISAHPFSAEDHEPVQGRVFLKEQYEAMQQGLNFYDIDGHFYQGFKRPIAEWNCHHFANAFNSKASRRMYTDDQLRQWAERNNKGCEINGKHYTIYRATQYMRQLETQIRRVKGSAVAAREAGDTELQKSLQLRINALTANYANVCRQAGLKPQFNRTMVYDFKDIKVA